MVGGGERREGGGTRKKWGGGGGMGAVSNNEIGVANLEFPVVFTASVCLDLTGDEELCSRCSD